MLTRDRRFGYRVPLEIVLDHYVADRRRPALTSNISETGVFFEVANRTPDSAERAIRHVALEIALPGTSDSIWARGEILYQSRGSLVCGAGVRFVAMARQHARLLRDFCVERRREHLGSLLHRLRPLSI